AAGAGAAGARGDAGPGGVGRRGRGGGLADRGRVERGELATGAGADLRERAGGGADAGGGAAAEAGGRRPVDAGGEAGGGDIQPVRAADSSGRDPAGVHRVGAVPGRAGAAAVPHLELGVRAADVPGGGRERVGDRAGGGGHGVVAGAVPVGDGRGVQGDAARAAVVPVRAGPEHGEVVPGAGGWGGDPVGEFGAVLHAA